MDKNLSTQSFRQLFSEMTRGRLRGVDFWQTHFMCCIQTCEHKPITRYDRNEAEALFDQVSAQVVDSVFSELTPAATKK